MPSTPLTLAMSTSWNIRGNGAIGPVLQGIHELGFSRVELNNLLPQMLPELERELGRRGMSIQSIHNPCPWPVDAEGQRISWGLADALSSLDEGMRAQALAWAKDTIRLAADLDVGAVILHLGQVQTSLPQPQLFHFLRAGRHDEFQARLERAITERAERRGPYLEAALASIRELGECADKAGVKLGVEARDGYHEIPSLPEFDDVFAATRGLPVQYWHDVGHVQKQQLLGLATQEEYLRRFARRLLGIHLHDTRCDRDHFAPGMGEIDYRSLARLVPAGALRTLELSDVPTPEDVRCGLELLRGLGLA